MSSRTQKLGVVFLYVLFVCFFADGIQLHAQITVSVNPANKQDARVLLTNPAAAAVTESRVYLGYKLIYPGAIPSNTFALKASFFNLSLPHVGHDAIATGLHGRYFTTPLFQEGRFGGSIARELNERVAVGLDLSLLFKSYATENFDLVDPDDPVFRGGSSVVVFDAGLGLLVQLNDKLAFAASASHLTQPNVALGDADSNLPLEALFGLSFARNFLRFDLGAHLWQKQLYPLAGAEIFSARSGRFRLGYGLDNVAFDGQLLLRGSASLFYSFNLPTSDLGLISAGSHEIGFVYTFSPRSQ
ncbi:MAG: type IX secretion system membrane protein PorP/SprF [candidate division KSB1 bacterium]|nr:type IX secretion system membrane protein PorP/SprF [candidate division KSB1 bacterium]MDZ7366986.1 type IX secretion system membrane protein PorP/SprF [candidate division KSB1 bacterium]MDZ7406809.1 type IX secretion system membrane protein PorP/SprF [candidate division KSB1 bacterium]